MRTKKKKKRQARHEAPLGEQSIDFLKPTTRKKKQRQTTPNREALPSPPPPSSAGEVTVAVATAEATAAEEGREETAGAKTGGPRREEGEEHEVRKKKMPSSSSIWFLFCLSALVPVVAHRLFSKTRKQKQKQPSSSRPCRAPTDTPPLRGAFFFFFFLRSSLVFFFFGDQCNRSRERSHEQTPLFLSRCALFHTAPPLPRGAVCTHLHSGGVLRKGLGKKRALFSLFFSLT